MSTGVRFCNVIYIYTHSFQKGSVAKDQTNTVQILSPNVGGGRPQCPSQGFIYKT